MGQCCSTDGGRSSALRDKDVVVEAREHGLGYFNTNPARVALHLNTVSRENKVCKSDFIHKA